MKNTQQLLIIGGGIMGLMTAYYASFFVKRIVILEKSTIGNKQAASFSFTRSMRNDYLDPEYSLLAYESQKLWKELQEKSADTFLYSCGCLNIAKKSVTPFIMGTYANQSYMNEKQLNLQTKKFTKIQLSNKFSQFNADFASLDIEAGFLYLPTITNLLLNILKKRKVKFIENADIEKIEEVNNQVKITCRKKTYTAKSLVITAALGTNALLKRIKQNTLQFPLYPDKPQECKYVYIPKKMRNLFLPITFPVFAYLDVGIYGHPIFHEEKSCIKIGFYNPPDIEKKQNKKIQSVDDFINECMPMLKNAKRTLVKDADQCFYDMVDDNEFILGKLPGYKNIVVGCGWRGTGYKFAPLIGKILMQLSIQKGTIYNITRFSPERFITKNYSMREGGEK